jgi:predicted nucleic acid-binding protein
VEVASALSAQSRRHLAVELEQRLRYSTICEVVWIDPELYELSWSLYRERSDKNWSLVDCSSFVLVRDKHINEALTADHHFEQAGFAKLI